ncbi:hypothetical protein MTR_3g096705 [Medicago truncatula]|uniref:Transmembrane protein n=1 Tax=Medicago truncatula TaxID=3880 RepID=A0A072V198_MEDTR|nr:hypothetical protein MTR_3g096705 [Medicago truncatula]
MTFFQDSFFLLFVLWFCSVEIESGAHIFSTVSGSSIHSKQSNISTERSKKAYIRFENIVVSFQSLSNTRFPGANYLLLQLTGLAPNVPEK